MGAKLGSGGGPMADINVTPLIDVVLVLLVVFMVITPMLQTGLPVDLPEATQTVTRQELGQHIVISVGANPACKAFPCDLPAQWYVEQDEVTPDTLIDAVNLEYRNAETARAILIKADRRLHYRQVREVMDLLAEKGMTEVLVAAKKEG